MDTINNIKSFVKSHSSEEVIDFYRKVRSQIFGFIHAYDLTKLAIFCGTDKGLGHFYTPHYQQFFRKFKFKRIKLLEIGVGGYKDPSEGGNSLRMWKMYFPFAQIFSIDIFDKKNIEEPRIRIYQGSQTDEAFLKDLIDKIGSPTIIVDDGSHMNEHVIRSFELLFPFLKPGGIYAIEDTGYSYQEIYGGDKQDLTKSGTTMNYFKSFPDRINRKKYDITSFEKLPFEDEILSIHFFHELILVEKKNLE